MDIRQAVADDGTFSKARFSTCGRYRYDLRRRWSEGDLINFIMLNPSTADEHANDPTIARCEKRARLWGFGGIIITNLFAWRATDPRDLKRAKRPEGPDNQSVVIEAASQAQLAMAAWGVHGRHLDQDRRVLSWLNNTPLHTLGLTKQGLPRHPLYVSYATQPEPWSPRRIDYNLPNCQ